MVAALWLAVIAFGAAHAQTTTPTAGTEATATQPSVHTASVTGCHNHGADVFCINGSGEEVQVSLTGTPTGGIPAQYTGGHNHGSEE